VVDFYCLVERPTMNKTLTILAILAILAITALCVNASISANEKEKRQSEIEWQNMLDPEYQIKDMPNVKLINKWCDYVFRQEKYYRGK
jgi:hypothetical protein